MLEGRNEHILNDGIIDDEENTMLNIVFILQLFIVLEVKEFSV